MAEEVATIKRVYAGLPDDTSIYPGHGGPSSWGEERSQNPYLTTHAK